MDYQIFWQIYHMPKYLEENEIEQTFQTTFYNFYEPVNDNTVLARNTTPDDVRSLTLKLASMADEKLTDTTDPQLEYYTEVRVYIDFKTYIEEVWSKIY